MTARSPNDSPGGRLTRDRFLDMVRIYRNLVHHFGAEEMLITTFAKYEGETVACGWFNLKHDPVTVSSPQ